MKIKIEELARLENLNPRTVKEYCYSDGCPTNFYRRDIEPEHIERALIPYFCGECDERVWYQLRTKKEVKE